MAPLFTFNEFACSHSVFIFAVLRSCLFPFGVVRVKSLSLSLSEVEAISIVVSRVIGVTPVGGVADSTNPGIVPL